MADHKRRKGDSLLVAAMPHTKIVVVFVILLASLWGNASHFDATELKVIRDVLVAMFAATGVQKVVERMSAKGADCD